MRNWVNPLGKLGKSVSRLLESVKFVMLFGKSGRLVRLLLDTFKVVKLEKPSMPVKSVMLRLLTFKLVWLAAVVVK